MYSPIGYSSVVAEFTEEIIAITMKASKNCIGIRYLNTSKHRSIHHIEAFLLKMPFARRYYEGLSVRLEVMIVSTKQTRQTQWQPIPTTNCWAGRHKLPISSMSNVSHEHYTLNTDEQTQLHMPHSFADHHLNPLVVLSTLLLV